MATHITVDCSKPNEDPETHEEFMARMAKNTTVRPETSKERADRLAVAATVAPTVAEKLADAGIDIAELKAELAKV